MGRENKLDRLNKRQNQQKIALIADDEFSDVLQDKIDSLKELLDEGISIHDLDGLIEELRAIKTFAPAVEELKKSIAELKIPDMPSEVKLDGLESLVKAVEGIKVPEAKVKVSFADKDQLDNVLKALDELTAITKARSTKQSPSDFVPIRKVVSLNNGKTLIFDDGLTGAHSGGGGGGSDGIIHGANGGSATVTDGKLDVNATVDSVGTTADAAATAGSTGSVQAKLRLLTSQIDSIKTAVETIDNAISGSEMQVDVVAALPAGSNAIGKLAANSGVDIGDVDVTSISAGTNTIGDVGIKPRTTGGFTTYHLVSAATTNATNIKASAGQVFGWYIYNSNAAARKVVFHNTAGTPTAGASVFFSIVLPPSAAANVFTEIGIAFSTGIAITTVTGLADSDATAVAANDLVINIFYA